MSKQFQFQLKGITFKLPIKYLVTTDYQGNTVKPFIKMNQVASASVVKQYVKKMYPQVVVSSTSSTFANGNSCDVYISTEKGGEVDEEIIRDVEKFSAPFKSGYYNSYDESYEYKDKGCTDNGTTLDNQTKWLSVCNRPKFVSAPDVYRMLIEMTQTTTYVFGMVSMEKAQRIIEGYGATDSNMNKALKLI